MSQVIRISNELYKRLEALASGFDTPSNVIKTILGAYEDMTPNLNISDNTSRSQEIQPARSLDIVYLADSEEDFKKLLLINKKAYIRLSYTNDPSEIKEWNASRFSTTSHVDGNLRSGYLRGWKERGIFKAELAVDRNKIA